MTNTFNCPHCEATYPVLPTLYGRAVRCSSCKNPFRLRGDGVVEKVGSTGTITRPKHKRQELSDDQKSSLTRTFIDKSKKEQVDLQTKRLKGPSQARISELRKSVSGALKDAADHVIAEDKTVVKSVSERIGKTIDRDKITAVLTNEGRTEQRIKRGFIIVLFMVLIAMYALVQSFMSETYIEKALRAYSAPTHSQSPQERQRVYLKRNWLYTLDGENQPLIILDTEQGHTGDVYDLDLTIPTTLVQDQLGGMTSLPQLAMWVDKSRAKEVHEIWAKERMHPPMKNFRKALSQNKIMYVTYAGFIADLEAKKVDPEAVLIYSMLLLGTTDERKNNALSEKILVGNGPMRCEIHAITGNNGREYVLGASGGEVFRKVRSYKGRIVRFVGEFWDTQWRILMMQRSDYIYPNPLLEKDRIFRATAFRAYESARQSDASREHE